MFIKSLRLLPLLLILLMVWNTHADSGGVLNFDEPVEGDIEPGEQDSWTFWGQAGQRVSVAAERISTELDPYLELRDPTGDIVVIDDNSGPRGDAALLGVILPTDGLYVLQVRSAEETQGGSYRLTLVENILPVGCQELSGTVVSQEWYSTRARETLRMRVYFPPCYQTSERRYPYVILMHGSNSTETHWVRLGVEEAVTVGVALKRLPPMAIVLPYGGDIANLNVFYLDGSYEHVILREVMDVVETQYCLQTSGRGRAIGGISRGGFWAWEVGLRHPELFTAIGGHSPVFDLDHLRDFNPLFLIQSIEWAADSPRLYIDRGTDDYWQYNIDLMPPRLEQEDIPYTYIVNPEGRHEDDYWAAHLADYLDFYSADWDGGLVTYPFCNIPDGGLLDAP